MNIFTQFFKHSSANSSTEKKEAMLRELMRRESDLNKNLFGPVPRGVKRDFFCLDKSTWIWYEEWTDKSGQRQKMTTRYVMRPSGMVKSINGGPYIKLAVEEAKNLHNAIEKYVDRASSELYVNHTHTK